MRSISLFRTLLAFLFPERCLGCGKEGDVVCMNCRSRLNPRPSLVTHETWRLFSFDDPLVRGMIHALKYEGKVDVAGTIAETISAKLDDIVDEDALTIVPIPSSTKESAKRSYDHVMLIARAIIARYHGPIRISVTPLLVKTRETPPQVRTMSRKERLTNLVGAYALAPISLPMKNERIVVLDDVTTTGATFTEARRALDSAGYSKKTFLAIAH